jgi:hypothetical protein
VSQDHNAKEQPEDSDGESLTDFYRRNGVSWGAADLFMIGDRGVHVAELVALLRAINRRLHCPEARANPASWAWNATGQHRQPWRFRDSAWRW